MNFDLLTNAILETHTSLQQSAVKAINHIANFLKTSSILNTLPPSLSNLSIVGSATPLLKEMPIVPTEQQFISFITNDLKTIIK